MRWAALGDLPGQQFPGLEDPYEPMLTLLERGGGFARGHGGIELGFGSMVIGSLTERAAQEPKPIDQTTLNQLDEGGSNVG